jgi:cytochrome c-type biogenesis protein CcmH/NrfG
MQNVMHGPAPERPGWPAFVGAALILVLLAAATIGAWRWPAPEPDPIAVLKAAEAARAGKPMSHAQRHEMLQRVVTLNPRDGRAWMLLAFSELAQERFGQAAQAIEQAVKVSRRIAADPAVWCEWADALGMAQGGSLAGRPTELIDKALSLSPRHPKALEMAGSAAYERRDFRAAVTHWEQLLPQLAEGTQPHAELSAAIDRARRKSLGSLPPG